MRTGKDKTEYCGEAWEEMASSQAFLRFIGVETPVAAGERICQAPIEKRPIKA